MPLFGLRKFGYGFVCKAFSHKPDAIALKLHTLIGGHQMTLKFKFHNSTTDFDWIMPLFGLRKFG